MLITDSVGRIIDLPKIPQTIISLVPSLTEFLFHICEDKQIIGGTRYCVYPEIKPDTFHVVGGTKKIHFETIKKLSPDIIIANKEENSKAIIDQLEVYYPVYVSNIQSVNDALREMESMAFLLGKEPVYEALKKQIKKSIKDIVPQHSVSFIYLIWENPLMAAGPETYISDFLHYFGLKNQIHHAKQRYPEINMSFLKDNAPDLLLLPSEPYSYGMNHLNHYQNYFNINNLKTKVLFVDGTMTSWYGSRMVRAIPYMQTLLSGVI